MSNDTKAIIATGIVNARIDDVQSTIRDLRADVQADIQDLRAGIRELREIVNAPKGSSPADWARSRPVRSRCVRFRRA